MSRGSAGRRAARLQEGWTPLIHASWHGHQGVVEALIGSKAALEAQDNVRLLRDTGDAAQGSTPPCEGCPMCVQLK